MKKQIILLLIASIIASSSSILIGQVGISTDPAHQPDPSAILDLKSTNQGLLMPRMTTTERDNMPNLTAGLIIFNTSDTCVNYYTGLEWVKDCGRKLNADDSDGSGIQGNGGDNNEGIAIASDDMGNFYIAGNFRHSFTIESTTIEGGVAHIFLAKFNNSGALVWLKPLGGTMDENVEDMEIDVNGDILITGSFEGATQFGAFSLSSIGSNDMFLCKIDNQGVVLWAKQSQSQIDGQVIGTGISTDEEGNIYTVGEYYDTLNLDGMTMTSLGGPDFYIAKYSSAGDIQWVTGGGGPCDVYAEDVSYDGAGSLYVAGTFRDTAFIGGDTLIEQGFVDFHISKFSTDGTFIWTNHYGDSESQSIRDIDANPNGVFATGNFEGSIIIGDTTLTNQGSESTFIFHLDPNGNKIWAKQSEGSGSGRGISLKVDGQNNTYVTGEFRVHFSFDTTNLMAIGSPNTSNAFTAKFGPAGSLLWMRHGKSLDGVRPKGIDVDNGGSVYMTGTFENEAIFDAITFSSIADEEFYGFKYNADGSISNSGSNLSASQDGDSDASNELIESAILNGQILEITDAGGTQLVDLSAIGNDADSDPTNELQNWDNLPNIPSDFADGIDDINDADADATNELITNADLVNTTLRIDDAGGTHSVDLLPLKSKWINSVFGVYLTNGSVGIGTTQPSTTLQVAVGEDASLTTDGYFMTGYKINRNVIIDNNEIMARDNGEESIFYINNDGGDIILAGRANSGNIGIGTSSPTKKLDVNGNVSFRDSVFADTIVPYDRLFVAGAIQVDQNIYAGDTLAISTEDPITKLHIAGTTDAGLADHGLLMLGALSDKNVIFDNNEIMARNNNNHSTLSLNHDGGDIILGNINSQGRVGIGTSSPLKKLDVHGNAIFRDSLGIGNTWNLLEINDTLKIVSSNSDAPFIVMENSGGFNRVGIGRVPTGLALEVSGNASKSQGGDWFSNSDMRLKKNITYLNSEEILQKMLSLRGVNYEWNDQKTGYDRPEGVQYGFIAQEIQKVFPEFVIEDSLGYLQTSYGTYDAMYVESLRALNEKIEQQEKMILDQQKLIEEILEKIQEIK